jgi:mercuric ion transport protein
MRLGEDQMQPSTHDATRDQGAKAGTGAVLLTGAGLVAAFGAAACCGLPLILAGFGLGYAWLLGPALLAAPHLTLLLVTAPLLLTGGAVLLWRQSRARCASNAICARPEVRAATLIGLLLGVAFLTLGYAYME